MRILLLGEASFVHYTLSKGLKKLGHDVVLMSDGNNERDCSRDIDLKRNTRYGKLGGLITLWRLLVNIRHLVGNDIVQIHNYNFVPLRAGWNKMLMIFLKLTNKKVVKYCLGDDFVILSRQAEFILKYSDTNIGRRLINERENAFRIEEQMLPEMKDCCKFTNRKADALLPCLYEYYLCYDIPEYHDKLYYMPLPMEIPHYENYKGIKCAHNADDTNDVDKPVRVLVGIQSKRDYIKGAAKIGEYVERLALENPGKIEVKKVYDVPYDNYLKLLDEADVLVDQLYSYTPSMNSLAAMAHGTVVIGGGEEEYYDFIGEKTLRPIINVRPEDDEYNMRSLRETLLYPERISKLKKQSCEFVCKYHDYIKVAENYVELYNRLLEKK